MRDHEKVEAAKNAAHEIAKYKKDAPNAKPTMKAEKKESVSLQQKVSDLEAVFGAKEKEMEDLRAAMENLLQDVIDKYKGIVELSQTMTKESRNIIPKAFWTSKKFLKGESSWLFA